MPINLDEHPENSDWIKGLRSWPLAPYKSAEFFDQLKELGMTLDEFRELPLYRRALESGLIEEEAGETEEAQ